MVMLVYQRVTSYGYIEYQVLTRNHDVFRTVFYDSRRPISGAPPAACQKVPGLRARGAPFPSLELSCGFDLSNENVVISICFNQLVEPNMGLAMFN
jgi:hypothetical protein